ncbi:hypothetical protein [Staphylococcus xylosus]|uniref:hypothetical protein n=1 Tax=Staphylococcus xylosus TaxID=1288 RepID=UPI003F57F421
MPYEYESENISKIMHYNNLTYDKNIIESYGEIREVYRKAKAFDEIVNIEDNYNKEKGFSPCVEEYTEEVEDIISKYMEDKQND